MPEADGMPPSEKASKGDGASMAASIFSLTNTIIGAGALSAPTLKGIGCMRTVDSQLVSCRQDDSAFSFESVLIAVFRHAGIMALPRAVATLGVVPGALLILLVYILTFITINVLSRCCQSFHYFFAT